MTALLDRVRTAMRSLGNDGALANVESDMATAAQNRAAVDHLARAAGRDRSHPHPPAPLERVGPASRSGPDPRRPPGE